MPQAVSRHLVTAEALSRSQVNPCEIGGGKSGIGTLSCSLLAVSFINNLQSFVTSSLQQKLV